MRYGTPASYQLTASLDPNITDQEQRALTVACPYCGAGIGMNCWTTRSTRNQLAGIELRYAHRQRVKVSWRLNGQN